MSQRRYQVIGGSGVAFSSGGTTNNVIPKEDGVGGLKDSSITDNATTVSTTEPILTTALGAIGANSIQVGQANTGLSAIGGLGSISLVRNGTELFRLVSGGLGDTVSLGAGKVGFASAVGGAADLAVGRRGAANFSLGGADVNGSPVAQAISVQNAITGSNLAAAASFTVAGPLGTGTGTTGQVVVTGGDSSVASGTTAQTGIIRVVLNATKALTSGAATTLVSIPLASLQMTGGYVSVYMEATDGTSQATRCEEIYYAGENSAGVFVTSTGVVGTGVTACTAAKTLTATYALTGANPALLQVTPTLTGITATRFTCVYQVCHGGNTQPTV